MSLPPKKELNELLGYLSKQEREEIDAILATMPTPLRIIRPIIRPDGSVEGYLVSTTEKYVELAPDDPLLKGYPPATPEQNGGYRPGERP